MERIITKVKSMNLYGETPAQEKRRLLKARVEAVSKGRDRNVSFGAGTTSAQKRRRASILRKAGLPIKTPRYLDFYSK